MECLEREGICSSHVAAINSSCILFLHSVAYLHKVVDKHYDMFIFPITYCFVKVHCTHSRPLPNGFRLGLCRYSLVFLGNRVILVELEVCCSNTRTACVLVNIFVLFC